MRFASVGRPRLIKVMSRPSSIKIHPNWRGRLLRQWVPISHTSIENNLYQLGYVSRLNVWVPHELTKANLVTRIFIYDSLRKRQESDSFLKRMMSDEKWVVYDNIVRKRSWGHNGEPSQTTLKAGLHPKKIMLSVWWDLLNDWFNRYYLQLTKLDQTICTKRLELANRKGLVFHHDNARLHTSLTTRNKLLSLGWDILPQYSPDLAPFDYHLFRPL